MVLSSQTNQVRYSPYLTTDVAACWGNLAGAAATGASGCKSCFLPNPVWVMLGDTETGHGATRTTLPFWKFKMGRWERCNFFPAGGCQHVGDDMSNNGVTLGDDQRAKGVMALEGASSQGRRIAQASNGNQYGCCGVYGCKWLGLGGHVKAAERHGHTQAGKGAVRNIWPPKAQNLLSDCRAKPVVMLVGLHLHESEQKKWLTWEAACYTSNTRFLSGR